MRTLTKTHRLSFVVFAALALAVVPACKPADAATVLTSSPARSGGAAVGWDALQWTRIQAILGTQVDNYIWSDLLNPSEYDITVGAAPFAQLAASTGGVLRNGGGSGTMYFAGHKAAAGSVVPIPNMKTSAWAVASRARFAVAPSGGGVEEDVVGMVGTTHQTSLQIQTNTSTTVMQVRFVGTSDTHNALSSVGTIGSGISTGTWFDYLLVNDPGHGLVVAQVNGVTGLSLATPSNMSTQVGKPFFDSNMASGLDIDAIMFAFKREP